MCRETSHVSLYLSLPGTEQHCSGGGGGDVMGVVGGGGGDVMGVVGGGGGGT